MVQFLKAKVLTIGLFATLALSGCSGTSGLTTASLFGGDDAAKAKAQAQAQAVAAPQDTPVKRAFQLGKVSARAVKCGYNFNRETLKNRFLQSEASAGLSVEEISKLDQVQNSAFRGVSRAVATQEGYCTAAKTKLIKLSLNRYLAGDFSSDIVRRKTVAKAQAFDWFDTSEEKKGPKFGSQDWWASQEGKIK